MLKMPIEPTPTETPEEMAAKLAAARIAQQATRRKRVAEATRAERKRVAAAREPQRQTERVRVHGAYSGVDRVERIVDTLTAMLRRKQIDFRQHQAGERLQLAHETVLGQTGGSMDFDRVRGGSVPGQPPNQAYLMACDTLRQAKAHLYRLDHAVVSMVCVKGLRVEDCGHLFGQGRAGREEAGSTLRRALGELAELWWPEGERHRTRRSVYRSEKSLAGNEGTIEVAGGVYVGA